MDFTNFETRMFLDEHKHGLKFQNASSIRHIKTEFYRMK